MLLFLYLTMMARMRILHLATRFVGGDEFRRSLKLC
jgi:hypothetical protein